MEISKSKLLMLLPVSLSALSPMMASAKGGAAVIPAQFHGRWAPSVKECAPVVIRDERGRVIETMPSDTMITVTHKGFQGFESGLEVLRSKPAAPGVYAFRARAGAAEDYAQTDVTLRMSGSRMAITSYGSTVVYVRCPTAR